MVWVGGKKQISLSRFSPVALKALSSSVNASTYSALTQCVDSLNDSTDSLPSIEWRLLHYDYLVLIIRFFLLLFLYTFRYFSLSRREVLVLVQILVLYPVCTSTAVSALTVYPGDSVVPLSADIPSGTLARTRVP